ncbi:hypothetical protein A4A49_09443 [Nicotiana attenuata]|uniref:Uncharacterized protein n=1 Tax=Nicotiana attenuata TaxID=49451 RepID=A0A314LBT6_NICAT|nr:hypothetical protein A4A49_09443 [Nicotiana attenuata]
MEQRFQLLSQVFLECFCRLFCEIFRGEKRAGLTAFCYRSWLLSWCENRDWFGPFPAHFWSLFCWCFKVHSWL